MATPVNVMKDTKEMDKYARVSSKCTMKYSKSYFKTLMNAQMDMKTNVIQMLFAQTLLGLNVTIISVIPVNVQTVTKAMVITATVSIVATIQFSIIWFVFDHLVCCTAV